MCSYELLHDRTAGLNTKKLKSLKAYRCWSWHSSLAESQKTYKFTWMADDSHDNDCVYIAKAQKA